MAEDGARPSSDSNRNSWVMSSTPASAIPFLRDEEVATSAHGITVALALAEPVVYLPHFDPADTRSVMLSGHLRLRLTRTVKIKKVELVFKGVAQKKIPNGILPKKSQVQNVKELNKHVWPVFLAGAHEGLSMSNIEYNANNFKFASPQFATINHNHNNKEAMDFSLQANFKHACGIGNCEPWARGVSRLHRGYKLFPPGDYTYDFEQLIDSHNPETIENEIISVRWLLQAVVEHSGAFQSNLSGIRYIPFIRSPVGECLEQVEPVAISRDWKDKLHYNITIFGKSFPLGSQIPIAIKLIPFAKITCRRIQVWVLENLHFHGRANHHVEPRKRFLLFEKTAHSASSNNYSGNSTRVTAGGGIPWNDRAAAIAGEEFVDHNRNNLLGDLSDGCQAGPIEMELNVQIPNCQSIKGKDEMQKLRCDATYESIEISHRIMVSAYQIKQSNSIHLPDYSDLLCFMLRGWRSMKSCSESF
ncbi:arrestin domain protein [Penicillium subrubescens]|uniref:arrestin domain protein n=1 Tax=Penicillium subrubescens TaxID=1316194 RepID=UPI00254567D8|nr:arrestin domain protein [Penicillium subrubescens]KAJ5900383.1 arrestin domain protein [Penicillium subrubescens]